jgi:hypothetical protein
MPLRLPLLVLALGGSFLFVGCAGPDSFRSIAHEGAEGSSAVALDDPAGADLGAFVQPVIESFLAQPLYLPLAGGDVELSWSARQATSCSLLINGQPNMVGSVGMAVVAIAVDTELELLCIDAEDEFDTMSHTVIVQTPPADTFSDEPPVLQSPYFVKVTTQSKFGANPVVQIQIALDEPSRLSLSPAALPLRSSVTLWLAQDSNEDGVVDPSEIIAIARSAAEENIQAELDEGKYMLFIESDGQAVDWVLSSYIVPLGEQSA